jgi:hypothetical protein
MKRAITNENTTLGAKSKFACVIGSKIWPTSTAEGSKSIIIWCDMEKPLNRSIRINDFAREKVYQKSGCEKRFIPIV